MYIIARKVNEEIEFLKDSSSTSNKVFENYSSAETFAKKLNAHTHSDKQWYVTKYEINQNDSNLSLEYK